VVVFDIRRHPCAYCGASATTRDHVPPKAWFARPVPNAIRVPACFACNNGRSGEDEKMRIAIGLFAGIRTPTLRKLWRKAVRTMDHSPALRRHFAEHTFRDDASGRTGVSLPKPMFDRAMERLVRALYWHHYESMLPKETPITVYYLKQHGFEQCRAFLLKDLSASNVGFDQFHYWYARAVDGPTASVWLFAFYRRVFFAVATGRDHGEIPGTS
jgi:hypothetical protein